ncbi:MAG: GumC family protein [Pyrinomonadaceae bacterium]
MNSSQQIIKRDPEVYGFEETANPAYAAYPPANYRLEDSSDEIHFRDYWVPVRKRLWLVAGITLLVTMAMALYMARMPDIYEAQARVQVDLENNPAFGSTKSGSVIISSPVTDPTYFKTQLQNISSPGLLRRVVKTLDLEHDPSFFSSQATKRSTTWQSLLRMVGLGSKVKAEEKKPTLTELPRPTAAAAAAASAATDSSDLAEAKRLAPYVNAIQSGLIIQQIRDTRLIDVRFNHTNPEIAARIVNSIADSFVLSNLERKTETTNNTGDFLQKRIAELQANIRGGEEQLINYAKSHQILSLDPSQNTVVDRLTALNKQLLEAENDRKLAEAAYRAVSTPGAAESLAEADSKKNNEVESKLGELKQKRAQLLVENTEEWPEVKEVNQQIAVLERQLLESRSRAGTIVRTNLETRYRQGLAREEGLRTAFNQQRSEMLTQNEAAINYRIIQQEIETNKALLDSLLQRSKENDLITSGTSNNLHVNDYALVPESPSGPVRMRSVVVAFFLSLAFGIGLALFLEYLDDTIQSTEDIENLLRLPALSVIPAIDNLMRRRLRPVGNALQLRNDKGGSAELLLNKDTRSPLAEAYRQLRTSVLLSTAGRAPKTLLITSSQPSEGKTTTAANIALSLAQTGAQVLIIDADMRRPRLHVVFNVGNQSGLSHCLSNDLTESELLNLTVQHEDTSLYTLTSGPVPPNPAELLGSDQMRRLIHTFGLTFTHIVIDSPPIASFTDGVLISTMVDGVLLVVHGGKSSRVVVQRSRQVLKDVGARILGVVLNNVKLRPEDQYYAGYYQKSYYSPEQES